jgi:hypothetical protein
MYVGSVVRADLLGCVLLKEAEVEPPLLQVLPCGPGLLGVAVARYPPREGGMAERERRYVLAGI